MSKVKQQQLSSDEAIGDTDYIQVNLWRDKVKVVRFSFCSPYCTHADEHNYKFDGQVFYKKRSNHE